MTQWAQALLYKAENPTSVPWNTQWKKKTVS